MFLLHLDVRCLFLRCSPRSSYVNALWKVFKRHYRCDVTNHWKQLRLRIKSRLRGPTAITTESNKAYRPTLRHKKRPPFYFLNNSVKN